VGDQVLLDHHRHQRGEQPRVGAGPYLQVDVGQLGGLGAPRVDDDHASRGVTGDLAQRRARSGAGTPSTSYGTPR
jgi:hypothetical protein